MSDVYVQRTLHEEAKDSMLAALVERCGMCCEVYRALSTSHSYSLQVVFGQGEDPNLPPLLVMAQSDVCGRRQSLDAASLDRFLLHDSI